MTESVNPGLDRPDRRWVSYAAKSSARRRNIQRPLRNAQPHAAGGYNAARCHGAAAGAARFLTVFAALAACAAAAVTAADSRTDRWWTGYGNGPDNARYFPSKQITRRNVSQLQVAWTYPFGETGQQSDRRARRRLWARPQRIARRARRGERERAVGARTHDGDDQPRHELLGERRRPRPTPDLRDERAAAGDRRPNRHVGHVVRHQRRRRPPRRARRPRSGAHREHPVEHPRRGLREPGPRRQRDGRRVHVAAWRHPRLRRSHRPAGVDVPHGAAAW